MMAGFANTSLIVAAGIRRESPELSERARSWDPAAHCFPSKLRECSLPLPRDDWLHVTEALTGADTHTRTTCQHNIYMYPLQVLCLR